MVAETKCQPWKWGTRSVCRCTFRVVLMAIMRTVMLTGIKDDLYLGPKKQAG